jgi:hypothetical protein
MVDESDFSVLAHSSPAVAAGLGVRLCSLARAVFDSGESGTSASRGYTIEVGPRFIGHVAMASHDGLVVVGHVADNQLQIWRGSARHLTHVADLASPISAGGLVSLIWYRDEWHLFARSEHGRSSHLVSPDLAEWTLLPQLADSFPAFAVSGVAGRPGDLLLAGRIFVDNTAFGWGLLRSDGRMFEARPVPLPLATQLGVVGPTVNRRGDTVLLLDSGHNRTVARSSGTGWALSLLVPDMTPVAAFADGDDMWLLGHDNTTGVPALARIDDAQIIALPDLSFGPDRARGVERPAGRVRAALVHDDHLILAREC